MSEQTPDQLIRMTYVSKATFTPLSDKNEGYDRNVINILTTSRRQNRKNKLVGALYFGNGYFFQCLEGTKQHIDALYAKLEKDERHTELKVLSLEPIEKVTFSSWEMKYAAIDQEVPSFLKSYGLDKFNPYHFTPEMTAELINILQKASEGLAEA
ncbi:BLUF domain-containing protein [Alkanindiges illinoisensis]|uniref:BLUF domain-containing protein n=1 Tax=Alkanindiges illinoisensis TaxID=197183 RepID=UPI00054CDB58|nr:BLUF domain-containing protein [Alkanindiges illinoisensis]